MNGVNFQASMHNIPQMERHQQDGHNTPIQNQDVNAEQAKEEAASRIDKPTQPDETESKLVNPDQSKRDGAKKRKKKQKKKENKRKKSSGERGNFIDFSA